MVRVMFLLAALVFAPANAAAPGAAELHLVEMDEIAVPIIDGDRTAGILRVKLVLRARDAEAAAKADARLPRLRAASVAAALEYGRLYASPSLPADVAQLANDMSATLHKVDPGIHNALIVEAVVARG